MAPTLSISPKVYELLTQRAQQVQTSPDELADRLLASSLQDEALRQQRLTALLATIHARTSATAPEEIEADITAAAEEVKEARRARRAS